MPPDAVGSRIVRSYYLLAGLYTLAASVIWGVNTLFLLDAGLSLDEVFIANAAFSAGTVLFEIPTGVVADTAGRRLSFLASTAVLAVTTLLYLYMSAVGAGVWAFALVSVFMGLGFTFYSGATEAWLVDALDDVGFEGSLDRVFARGQMVSGTSMLIGTVSGGLLGTIDLALPFVARALMLLVLFVIASLTMFDRGFTPVPLHLRTIPGQMAGVARTGVRFGWRDTALRRLTLSGLVQSAVFIWVWYAWQPYFLELLGRDAVWVAGLVSALVALSTIAGNALVEWFTRFCGRRTTLLLAAATVQAVAAIGIGLASSFWWALVMLLLVTGALGVAMPVRQSFFHNVVPGEHRATVISFDSMLAGVGGVGGQLGLGRSAAVRGIGDTYVLSGVMLAVAIPFIYGARRADSPGDPFAGSKADARGYVCRGRGPHHLDGRLGCSRGRAPVRRPRWNDRPLGNAACCRSPRHARFSATRSGFKASGVRPALVALAVVILAGSCTTEDAGPAATTTQANTASTGAPTTTSAPPTTTAATPTTTSGSTTTADLLPPGSTYVALGSSYAAGTGAGPYVDISCGRGDASYPRRVATERDLSLIDASCGGAHIDHVVGARQVTGDTDHPPQIDSVPSDADLVSITVGGNDLAYVGTLLTCHAGCPPGLLDDTGSRALRATAVTEELIDMLRQVAQRAPSAHILLVGYPRLFADTDETCGPLSATEIEFFRDLGERLQGAFLEAADRAGVLYVDPYEVFGGHGVCADPDQRWVEGTPERPGTASWHPNAAGAAVIGDLVLARLEVDG